MRNFQLSGHLGADPKFATKADTTWVSLRIATNDRGKTQWFWVTAFNGLAKSINDNLRSGDGISIAGHLKVNDHNGTQRIELIAESADFFSKPKG